MKDKLCLFAGTTEGRILAQQLAPQLPLTVCVATPYGEEALGPAEGFWVHTGRMDREEMARFFRENAFSTILDATHPYAGEVSRNIKEAAERCGLPLIRVLREETEGGQGAVWLSSPEEAAAYLAGRAGKVLLTTGSKELAAFGGLKPERLWARVLPLESSLAACRAAGIPPGQIIAMQGPFSEEMNLAQLRFTGARYLVTKESGQKGGFSEKMAAAQKAGVIPVVIGRPGHEEGLSLGAALELLREKYGLTLRRRVVIAGIGPGNPAFLTAETAEAVRRADCILGARRMVEALAVAGKPVFCSISPQEIRAFLDAHPEYLCAAAVMSGDTGFYSGAKKLREALDGYETETLPGISAAALLAARLGVPWENWRLLSLHGREGGLLGAVRRSEYTFVLTGGENSAGALCRRLCDAGLGELSVTVGERLSYPEERLTAGTAAALSKRDFDPLSVLLIHNPDFRRETPHGIPDKAFLRGERVPMTKSEVRSVSLAGLGLQADSVVYDIGAGTGSVSVECALAAFEGQVYAVERKPEALALARENARRFALDNVTFVEGSAPEALKALPAPTHAFIGGSGGALREILTLLLQKNPGVRIVLNAVTLDTLMEAQAAAKALGLRCETTLIQVSRVKPVGGYQMMQAQNPVYILQMERGEPSCGSF